MFGQLHILNHQFQLPEVKLFISSALTLPIPAGYVASLKPLSQAPFV